MQIELNGQPVEFRGAKLTDVLEQHVSVATFAIAINGQFVTRSDYADRVIQSGDKVEILTPMQGG